MQVPGRDLSLSQQEQLYEFMTIVSLDDPERALGFLEANHWDMQAAAAMYFAHMDGAPEFAFDAIENNQGNFNEERNGRSRSDRRQRHQNTLSAELPRTAGESASDAAASSSSAASGSGATAAVAAPPSMLWRLVSLPFNILGTGLAVLARFVPIFRSSPARDSAAQVRDLVRRFDATFGSTHPPVYEGGYRALTQAAKRDAKLALVYLHSPHHYNSDEFCRAVICSPALVNLVQSRNMLFWMGDITDSEAFQVSTALGIADFPYMAVLAPISEGGIVLARAIEGNQTVDNVIAALLPAIDSYGAELITYRADREAHDSARRLREEQEAMYAATMAADAARMAELQRREEQEREEQERQRRAEEQARREAEEQQRRREEEERRRREHVEKLRASLPPEPAAGPEATTLMIRLPNGSQTRRRFPKSARLSDVMHYLETQDVDTKRFNLAMMYPKKVFTDQSRTLLEEELLNSQLILQEIA